ncbi:sodium/potassium/calcium exchanger 6-like protein [Leptotrombidium deliense]|uniref:Sodium/potassium/calcium exchanger 6-like protein n=1 Tax=Leptotrombidium deliense TaxID=299467 RepID=A0A443SCP5_9ACAR|nr:sodium/potassium/calcium exchanger 6-like protein [Leptotrombidium deliense]
MIPESDLYSEFIAVNSLNSTNLRCGFVHSEDHTASDDGFINYMQLFYCTFGNQKLKAVPFSVIWLLVLFTGLGVTADDFLCPSLLLISKTLRLSQNIAGVTFLAFGNGAPDIFSSLAGIKQSRPELVIGELFGIFVTTVVAGSIFLNQEFDVMKRPLMRDLIFYLFASYFTWFIFFRRTINIYHAIGEMHYLCFVLLTTECSVYIGRIVNNKYRSQVKSETCFNESQTIISQAHSLHCRSRLGSVDTLTASVESRLESMSEFKEFLIHICPIDLMEWTEETLFSKICQLWKSPLYFLLTITVPVVDFESHKNNWCRLLNCIHCVTGPFVVLVLTSNLKLHVGGCPVAVIVMGIALVFSILVYFTSIRDFPPSYHWIFGYLGFVVSVIWIYALANEVVSLLRAIGIMFDLSDVILGLTVLAWGNSLGDLISNLSMARQGFPRMGISACFGGPLLSILFKISKLE